MVKTVYTLVVDDYAPDIVRITRPLLYQYCKKIGARFYEISERKFPEFPPVYEKLQIYELGKLHGNDWNIYVDADALVCPDQYDITVHVHKDTIVQNGFDMASIRWVYDTYFMRDGRNIGCCNWFTVASDYGLKTKTIEQLAKDLGGIAGFLYHVYTYEIDRKADILARVVRDWHVLEYYDEQTKDFILERAREEDKRLELMEQVEKRQKGVYSG